MKFTVAGRYKITAIDSESQEERVVVDWFDNTITDMGMNSLSSGNLDMIQCCYLGYVPEYPYPILTGSTFLDLRAVKTTQDATRIYGTDTYPEGYGYTVFKWKFNPGAVSGDLSLVGCGLDSLGLNTFSQASIVSPEGNSSVIKVEATDTLIVYYEIRCSQSVSDVTTTINIAGGNINCLIRPVHLNDSVRWGFYQTGSFGSAAYNNQYTATAFSGAIGSGTGSPTGDLGNANLVAPEDTYVTGSYIRDGIIEFPTTTGNSAGGIKSMVIPTWLGSFQIGFTPPIMKTASNALRMNYRISWERGYIA